MIKILLTLATFLLLFATYFHSIFAINQDLGRHIKTGEIIVNNINVPKTNLFSYAYPSFPFINHHWGSEVLFYLIYALSGFTGTLILTALASITAFLLLFYYSLAYFKPATFDVAPSGSFVLTAFDAVSFVSFLSLGILFERTDVRPEAFSFLLMSLFLTILFKNREKQTRWIYALIPLQLLWVNMHVYFITGIVLVGLFFLDALITSLRHSGLLHHEMDSPLGGSRIRILESLMLPRMTTLFFVLISCSFITLLNPNGLSGALYPFHVFDNYGYQIEENQNIFFLWEYAQKRTIVFFWTAVFLFFITLFLRARHTRPIDWLLAIVFSVLGVQAIRNFPLFVFAVFVPFTYHLSALFHHAVILGINETPESKTDPGHTSFARMTIYKNFFFLVMVFLLLWQLNYVLTAKPFGFTTPNSTSNAVDFMIEKKIKGPIFNNFDIGSYLIFRLYPDEKVFVDGRPEAYPASFFQNTYIPMQLDPKLFEMQDKKYHFSTIFFSHTDQTPWAKQFLLDIVKNPEWQPVYLNDTIIIFIKKSNAPALSLASFHPSPTSSTLSLLSLFLFFQTIENTDKQIEILQQILQKDPDNCTALSILAQSQTPTSPIYKSRYLAICR